MKQLLLVVFGQVSTDPRVLRQIDALSGKFNLSVAGFGPFDDERVRFHSLGNRRSESKWYRYANRMVQVLEVALCSLRLYSLSYASLHPAHLRLKRLLRSTTFDLILINDSEGIAVATRYASGNPLFIHDQHEYWPDLFINPLKRFAVSGYRRWYVKKYLSRIPNWITVSEGIAALYQKNFSLPDPVIITNASGFVDLKPTDVANDRIDLVHHGIWDPGRGIELMIEALSNLPEHIHLNLLILGRGVGHLRSVAAQNGVFERVHFHKPVRPRDISSYINRFDVAIILNLPVNESEKHALPNKLFESIQGRLAIITGPSPEIEKIVVAGKCGKVLDSFTTQALSRSLMQLSANEIMQFKQGSDELARSLTAEENAKTLRGMVSNLLVAGAD